MTLEETLDNINNYSLIKELTEIIELKLNEELLKLKDYTSYSSLSTNFDNYHIQNIKIACQIIQDKYKGKVYLSPKSYHHEYGYGISIYFKLIPFTFWEKLFFWCSLL